MYVWGGRFQSVHQISGMWRLDLFNSDANLEYELAQPDGIEQYEAELEALHMFIVSCCLYFLKIWSPSSNCYCLSCIGNDDVHFIDTLVVL